MKKKLSKSKQEINVLKGKKKKLVIAALKKVIKREMKKRHVSKEVVLREIFRDIKREIAPNDTRNNITQKNLKRRKKKTIWGFIRFLLEENQKERNERKMQSQPQKKIRKPKMIQREGVSGKKYKGRISDIVNTATKIAIVAGLIMGVGPLVAEANTNDMIVYALVDDSGDEYIEEIPILIEGEEKTITVPNSSLAIGPISTGTNIEINILAEDGNIINGTTDKKYLKELCEINSDEYDKVYRVNVASNLNLRENTQLNEENKIGKIYDGEYVLGGAIESSKDNDFLWVPIVHINENEVKKGYVASEYLEEIKGLEENTEEIDVGDEKQLINEDTQSNENILGVEDMSFTPIHTETRNENIVNEILSSYVQNNGQVLGIDVSKMSAENLRKLLTGEITLPERMYSDTEKADIVLKDFKNRRINYVYIKLGATGYDNFKFVDFTNYKELVKVCEECKVPYGLYYYSTSLNITEAKKEATRIKSLIKSLGNETEYNLLPLAIDVEVKNGGRQDGVDTTNTKAYLANSLEKEFGKTLLYTSRNASMTSQKVIDVEEYNNLVNSGESDVWFVAPLTSRLHNEGMDSVIANDGADVTMRQIGLDGDFGIGLVDIDSMEENAFKKYINGEYKSINYSKDKKSSDIERL